MREQLITKSSRRRLITQPPSSEIPWPPHFWRDFCHKLEELGKVYEPVTLHRLYPFLVSRLPAKYIEMVLVDAQRRGLIAVYTRSVKFGDAEPTSHRVVSLTP
jgi:hypothetical protein